MGVLQFDSVKSKEMKDMITKEYYRRIRKILKASLNARNIMQVINARAVSIIRYGTGIVEWRKNELEVIDRKKKKLLTMYSTFHPKTGVDRLYWKRKNGGKGLISVLRAC